MIREIWKDIPGYEGLYQASDSGRIRNKRTGLVLNIVLLKSGYCTVNLCKNGVIRKKRVHRLVWIAFNGPIPEGMQINHKDEVKTNNNLENLSLVTCRENCNWGTRNKRMIKSLSRMVEQYTLDGAHICTWFSLTGIHEEFGYSAGGISNCCNGKRKTAYGFVWKYA